MGVERSSLNALLCARSSQGCVSPTEGTAEAGEGSGGDAWGANGAITQETSVLQHCPEQAGAEGCSDTFDVSGTSRL